MNLCINVVLFYKSAAYVLCNTVYGSIKGSLLTRQRNIMIKSLCFLNHTSMHITQWNKSKKNSHLPLLCNGLMLTLLIASKTTRLGKLRCSVPFPITFWAPKLLSCKLHPTQTPQPVLCLRVVFYCLPARPYSILLPFSRHHSLG